MIDTHSHLDLMDAPLEQIMADCETAGVTHMIQIAVDQASSINNIQTYAPLHNCSVSMGVHPLYVDDSPPIHDVIKTLEPMINDCVAIGETGFDFKYGDANRDRQQDFFVAQLNMAQQHKKPAIIHMRQAEAATLAVLNNYPNLPKVIHCYSTGIDFFNQLLGPNNMVSFTGLITYSSKGKLIKAVRDIPLENIMIETDSPYLRPKIKDSKQNETMPNSTTTSSGQNSPAFVGAMAHRIAEIKGIAVTDVIKSTTENAIRFFNL